MAETSTRTLKAGATPGQDSTAPPWLRPRAAYVHIPFCAHHCGYCDFAVAVGHDDLIDLYLEALAVELATLQSPQAIETLFIGGGTPTYLRDDQLSKLLKDIARWLPLAPRGEFTIEANPGTLTPDKIAVLADHGVNRVSLGAQSFQPGLLKTLERDHQPDDVPRAVSAIRERIAGVAMDLIFGVPGQTISDWDSDLRQGLALGPDHISTYGLTYEKGTPLWKQRERGQVSAVTEDDELSMYGRAIDLLESAGFEHYEISNFAQPGRQCRHNLVYWANEAYFGFGVGAARYIDGRRELNSRDLRTYIKRILSGETAIFQSETLDPVDRARETLAVQLRRSEGIARDRFLRQTGSELDKLIERPLAQLTSLGLLADDEETVRLTRQGKYVADTVIAELLKG
jgi:oxygen-independent coproporphyrinogen III oxidase